MTGPSAEAAAAASGILKALAGTGGQFGFPGWEPGLAAAGRALTAGLGVQDPDRMRVFWESLAEAADVMPWQGKVPVRNGVPVIERDSASGKVILEPVKNICVDGRGSTDIIVCYAAAVAGISTGLLPWKLSVEIRPGRVRAWQDGKAVADLAVTPAAGIAARDAGYGEHNGNSAGRAALLAIAARREAAGDEPGRLAAVMAASGFPQAARGSPS